MLRKLVIGQQDEQTNLQEASSFFASCLVTYIGMDTNLVTDYRELCILVWY